LEARRLRDEPMTLEDLSVKYDISRERVRQIEVRAFEKLQEKMKAALAH
jgi:RNA polymerase sigma-32 factor